MKNIGRRLIALSAAIGFSIGQPTPGSAKVVTFAQQGNWEAFGGSVDGGKAMCGLSSAGGGRWFGIKYFEGDDGFTVQLSKSSWKVKNGVKIRVQMQFDEETPWKTTATSFHMSDGDAALEFSIPIKQVNTWINEFRAADWMYVRFPDQNNIDDWQADLAGTNSISNALVRCIKVMSD